MNSSITLLFLACALSLAGCTPTTKIADLKSLPFPQKLSLLTLSSLQPKKYGQLTWRSLFSEDDLPWVDYMFVDIRSLLTQSIKVSEQVPLPELDYTEHIEFCILFWCVDDTLTLTTRHTQMIGQKRTSSVNEITPNSFKNAFHAPAFVWHSPDFLFNITDNIYDDQYLYSDLYIGINNLELNTSLNYEYVNDLGIQVRNLSIDFNIGYLKTNLENITFVYYDGSVEVSEPYKQDYTEYLISDWDYYKDDYQRGLEFRINCVLVRTRMPTNTI